MDVVGKIIAALPPKSGTSQSTGKPWQVNTYVLQTTEQTPKNIAFDVFGAERVEQYNLKVVWSQCQSTSTLTNTTDVGTTKSEPGTL